MPELNEESMRKNEERRREKEEDEWSCTARISVRYGEMRIVVPAKYARRALRIARSLSAGEREERKDEERRREEARRDGEETGRESVEKREERGAEDEGLDRVRPDGVKGEETEKDRRQEGEKGSAERAAERIARKVEEKDEKRDEKASRNWNMAVRAQTLEQVLDSLPKFKNVFIREKEEDVCECGDGRPLFSVVATFMCSRGTLTKKSMKDGLLLVSAEKRGRITPAEIHKLLSEGYREFAGVTE